MTFFFARVTRSKRRVAFIFRRVTRRFFPVTLFFFHVARRFFHVAFFFFHVARRFFRVTFFFFHVARRFFRVTFFFLRVTRRFFHVVFFLFRVTRRFIGVAFFFLRVTRRFFHVTFFFRRVTRGLGAPFLPSLLDVFHLQQGTFRVVKTTIHRAIVSLLLPKPIGLLVSVVQAIIEAMTGNPRFPSPSPALNVVAAALAELVTAQSAALTRAKGAVETRNAKRAALLLLVDELRGYVQKCGDLDPENAAAIIQSAGMGVHKQHSFPKRVFAVLQGRISGSVDVTAPVVARRASYDWQWSTDGGKTWQSAPSTTRSRTSLSGLAAGSTVSFRFRGNTKAGDGEWSQVISFLVK